MDNMIGKMLDNRYELLEVIGSGGMSVVYKAKCHRLNRLVAVKLLKSDLAEDADFRRHFRGESQAVAMLSHPNIVSVYDVSRGETEYIVMELIDGITLKQYMERRGQLNWREALHFITQIMHGLSHAHSRGIVHRDIKPQNIMVLRDGSVKVADFGIASLINSSQTVTQQALGSVHYISPEQAKGERTDARSDIYSAGVVLYEMLTNRLPFEGDSAVSVAIQHLSSVPLSPREINPQVPEALELICMKAMASDIDKRYPSAEAMLDDLEEFRKNPEVDLAFTIEDLRGPKNTEPTQYLPKVTDVRRTAEDEGEEEEGPRIPRVAIIVAAAALCAAIGFGLWRIILSSFNTPDPTPTEYQVPSLIGMTLEQARADSRVSGVFEIEQIGQRSDSEHPAGQIIEQSPVEGSKVKGNRVISVFLSTGVKSDVMPELKGTEYRGAIIALRQLGLDLDIRSDEEEYSDEIEAGCVIRTFPDTGTTLKAGDSVRLIVSKGRERKPVVVITFEGSSLATVERQLNEMGLVRGRVEEEYSDTVAYGNVIRQSIAPLTPVDEGTVIDFVVSKGPEQPKDPTAPITGTPQDPTAPVGGTVTP